MNLYDIIEYVRQLKKEFCTNNPYKIAEYYGIKIIHRDTPIKDFTAYTIKQPGYPTFISINNAYTDFSKKLLCAHELGHALLHENGINHFNITAKNMSTNAEQEANLFALALMMEDNIDKKLSMPLASMKNYLLKTIMEHNLKFKC